MKPSTPATPELSPDPAEFFAQVEATYAEAAHAGGRIERWFAVDGRLLRLCFAGPSLVPALTPALAHLAIDPPAGGDAGAQAHLTLHIWDSESTGTPRLVAPWTLEQVALRGEVPAFSNARYLTAAQRDMPAMSILDTATNRGYFWIADPGHIFVFERAAPMKVVLHWWLRAQNLPMIHAAALGTDAGAVLIVGKTGAGKSTTSLLCLEAGMKFIADDRCLLQLDSPPRAVDQAGDSATADTTADTTSHTLPHALCIYNSAKLHAAQMHQFPALRRHVINGLPDTASGAEEKSLIFVAQLAADQIALRLPIRALFLARVAHVPETTLAPVGGMAVLRELVTSTLVYQPGAVQHEVQAMTKLVHRVPAYQLNLGTRWAQIPQVIRQTLSELGGSGG